jgi:hypothetical protein
MTAEKYQEIYGTAPFAPSDSVLDAAGKDSGAGFGSGSGLFRNQIKKAQDAGGDLSDFFEAQGQTVGGAISRGKEIVGRETLNPIQKTAGVLGQFGGAVAGTVGNLVIGAGKLALTQEQEDKFAEITQKAVQPIAQSQAVKDIAEWYDNLDEDNKLIVDASGGILALMSEVGLGGVGKRAIDPAIDALKEGARVTTEAVATGARALDASRIAKQEQAVDTAVGRILQGKPGDIEAGRKALSGIDTEGVKTYAELNTRLDESMSALGARQDAELEKFTQVYRADELTKQTEVGDTLVSQSPVNDALDGLQDAYLKSGDAVNAERIVQLRNTLDTQGLTLKQLNDLAREYGREFKRLAFDKLGNAKQGFNAQNFESVRRDVKSVVRDRLPDDVSKEIDLQMSSLFSTKTLVDKMEVKVNALEQRIKNRSLAQKAGGAIADVADLATFGVLRGFVQKLLPSNVGLKTANSADLERELVKNLKEIDKLLDLKDEKKFMEGLDDLINSRSFNTGATPTKLSDELISHEGAPDKERVKFWKKKIEDGEDIPPLLIIKEGDKFGIEDGKHRFQAYNELGIENIPVKVIEN